MAIENKDQGAVRAEFYGSPAVSKHILTYGVPRSDRAFMDMVVSGTAQNMDDKEGRALMTALHQVVFRVHAQQINIMDKTSGKTIASIRR